MKNDIDWLLRQTFDSDEKPDSRLNQRILNRAREKKEECVRRRKPSIVFTVVILMVLLSITIVASRHILTPVEMADRIGSEEYKKVFEKNMMVEVNQTQELGEYTVTFVGIAVETDMESLPYYKWDPIPESVMYAALTIEKTDGTPMGYSDRFEGMAFLSASDGYELLSGFTPAERENITGEVLTEFTDSGDRTWFTENGVQYMICRFNNKEALESYKDQGVYLGVIEEDDFEENNLDSILYSDVQKNYLYDKKTGTISLSPYRKRNCVIFELPLDSESSVSNGKGSDSVLEEKERYINNLMEQKVDENTLVIYTSGYSNRYSKEIVTELNRMVKEKGYTWQIEIRQIPDVYQDSLPELAAVLKEKEIPADIFSFPTSNWDTEAWEGLFLDLEAYLNTESGKKLKAQLSETFWELSESDGHHYFIGTLDELSPHGWAVNQELMEKYGFSEEDLAKPLEELGDVFQTVWEGEIKNGEGQEKQIGQTAEDFRVFTMIPENLINTLPFSSASHSLSIDVPISLLHIGFWTDSLDDSSSGEGGVELVNLFDTERMRNLTRILNEYYQKGYMKNSNTSLKNCENFFMQPDYNGFGIRREDSLDTWTNSNGIALKRIPYYSQDTASIYILGNAVLDSSVHQEEALEFLNFVMTDSSASDLLLYGKEGIDYEKTADGTVEAGENLKENYYYRILGNMRIASPVSPYEDSHKAELIDSAFDELQDSPLCGFQFDITPVHQQVEAIGDIYMHDYSEFIKNVFQFEQSEERPEKNWEEYYDSFCQKLKNAGIDEVVEEMNRQLKDYHKTR